MRFEWDENKDAINQAKHKISFETALHVFEDPYRIERFDGNHSYDENRYIAIGKVEDILFVVFTERKDVTRLISARFATASERRTYYDYNLYA